MLFDDLENGLFSQMAQKLKTMREQSEADDLYQKERFFRDEFQDKVRGLEVELALTKENILNTTNGPRKRAQEQFTGLQAEFSRFQKKWQQKAKQIDQSRETLHQHQERVTKVQPQLDLGTSALQSLAATKQQFKDSPLNQEFRTFYGRDLEEKKQKLAFHLEEKKRLETELQREQQVLETEEQSLREQLEQLTNQFPKRKA